MPAMTGLRRTIAPDQSPRGGIIAGFAFLLCVARNVMTGRASAASSSPRRLTWTPLTHCTPFVDRACVPLISSAPRLLSNPYEGRRWGMMRRARLSWRTSHFGRLRPLVRSPTKGCVGWIAEVLPQDVERPGSRPRRWFQAASPSLECRRSPSCVAVAAQMSAADGMRPFDGRPTPPFHGHADFGARPFPR